MVTESDQIVAETAARIFADLADPQTVNNARDSGWKTPLWGAISEAGLSLAWVPDHLGGAGASMAEGFAIVAAAGRCALPVPLAETLLAGWLLSQAGLESRTGAMTVAPVRPCDKITLNADGTLSGRASGVPFASEAEHIVVLASGIAGLTIALVKTADCRVSEGANLAGDASNRVTFERVKAIDSASQEAQVQMRIDVKG